MITQKWFYRELNNTVDVEEKDSGDCVFSMTDSLAMENIAVTNS